MTNPPTAKKNNKPKLSILVLAAGSSRRFTGNQSKLLAPIGNLCLLEKVLHELKPFNSESIHIVINQHSADIEKIASHYHYVTNVNTEQGLASSLRTGIAFIRQQSPSTEAVLIILGDQPAVTTSDLKLLVDNFYLAHKTRVTESKQQVILAVAGIYGTPPTPGVPAVFDKQLFNKLCSLKGDQGAKPILNKLLEQQSLLCVEMPNAAVDIDTQEDLKNYCQ